MTNYETCDLCKGRQAETQDFKSMNGATYTLCRDCIEMVLEPDVDEWNISIEIENPLSSIAPTPNEQGAAIFYGRLLKDKDAEIAKRDKRIRILEGDIDVITVHWKNAELNNITRYLLNRPSQKLSEEELEQAERFRTKSSESYPVAINRAWNKYKRTKKSADLITWYALVFLESEQDREAQEIEPTSIPATARYVVHPIINHKMIVTAYAIYDTVIEDFPIGVDFRYLHETETEAQSVADVLNAGSTKVDGDTSRYVVKRNDLLGYHIYDTQLNEFHTVSTSYNESESIAEKAAQSLNERT